MNFIFIEIQENMTPEVLHQVLGVLPLAGQPVKVIPQINMKIVH